MIYTRDNISGIKFVHKNEPDGKVYSIDMTVNDIVYIGNHLPNYTLHIYLVIEALTDGTWIPVIKKIYDVY